MLTSKYSWTSIISNACTHQLGGWFMLLCHQLSERALPLLSSWSHVLLNYIFLSDVILWYLLIIHVLCLMQHNFIQNTWSVVDNKKNSAVTLGWLLRLVHLSRSGCRSALNGCLSCTELAGHSSQISPLDRLTTDTVTRGSFQSSDVFWSLLKSIRKTDGRTGGDREWVEIIRERERESWQRREQQGFIVMTVIGVIVWRRGFTFLLHLICNNMDLLSLGPHRSLIYSVWTHPYMLDQNVRTQLERERNRPTPAR